MTMINKHVKIDYFGQSSCVELSSFIIIYTVFNLLITQVYFKIVGHSDTLVVVKKEVNLISVQEMSGQKFVRVFLSILQHSMGIRIEYG